MATDRMRSHDAEQQMLTPWPEDQQQQAGVDGGGRLIASCCSHLDLFHLRSLSQGGKLRLAQGRLQDPDVQWSLVVVRDFGGDKASVRLANVSGAGRARVRFTGRVDTETTFRGAHPGTERTVGPDGLIEELTNFFNGQQSKMQVHVGVYHSSATSEAHQGDDLSADLGKLLDQGVLSDVVLQVLQAQDGRRDMRAHRAVLAARSPVFHGLFMSDMAESRASTVAVDFPAPVMERVLRYAYTGRLEREAEAGEEEAAGGEVTEMDVLAAADYYQLAGLKRLCEERLLRRVTRLAWSPEEVLQTVVLADRYGAAALKERALDAAAGSLKQLRARPEWKAFARQHPDLVAELMGVMADKLEQAQLAASQQERAALGPLAVPYLAPGETLPHGLEQILFNRVIRFS